MRLRSDRCVMSALGGVQVRELDLATLRWRRADTKGTPPPFRIHSSAAVVGDKWIIHGGRRPGKFNVTNQTFVYNFTTNRCADTSATRENLILTSGNTS